MAIELLCTHESLKRTTMENYIERTPLRIVSADEMFPEPTEQVDQSKMHWSEYHPMYNEDENE